MSDAQPQTARRARVRRHLVRAGVTTLVLAVVVGGIVWWVDQGRHYFFPKNWGVVEEGRIYDFRFASIEHVSGACQLFRRQAFEEIGGYPATFHVRDFLDCVKTRAKPKANADVACFAHIACHAAAIAWQLGRKVTVDPTTERFVGDETANRMCTRAKRAPWRV